MSQYTDLVVGAKFVGECSKMCDRNLGTCMNGLVHGTSGAVGRAHSPLGGALYLRS